MSRSTFSVFSVCLLALLASGALATFTLNGFDIREVGALPAKFILTNNRLLEFNFDKFNPPTATRMITILDICLYDAVAYFHPTFIPLIAKDLAPKTQFRDIPNAERALAYAAYRCINELWASPTFNRTELPYIDQVMANRSYPITDLAQDNSPAGIGNRVARRVLDYFYNDGANQLGNDTSSNGEIFGDFTNYYPINDAGSEPGITDCARIRSLGHWVPLRYPTGAAAEIRLGDNVTTPRSAEGSTVPTFAGVGAGSWKPIAISSPSAHRPPPPPQYDRNSATEFRRAYDEVKTIFENLNDTSKMIAEYFNERQEVMMGGPMGRLQEWSCIIAYQQGLDVFESVKINLLQGIAMYDSGITAWETKRYYQLPRPISVLQCLYENQTINSWRGPYLGVGPIPGRNWFSYTTPGASSPPFPGFISGHATFSGATAQIFKRWNGGNDTLDWQFIYAAGSSLMEPRRLPGDPLYVAGVTDVPNQGPTTPGFVPAQDLVLRWNTFTEVAQQIALARVYGGVHILADGTVGNQVGRDIADVVWDKLSCAFRGIECCAPKLV